MLDVGLGRSVAWAGGIDEIRVGGFSHNIDNAGGEAGSDINVEVLFPAVEAATGNQVVDLLLSPRLHIGADINTNGDTSLLYSGLSWELPLNDWSFVELSLGGAVHDGPTQADAGEASFGCRLNFHESISLGVELTENWRLLATVDHMSNADLCDINRGLTNAGIRLGYRFN